MARRDLWLLLSLCWLALALRLWQLGDAPLWLDEAFTWHDARQPLALILGARVDVHPPLYYGVLHLWLPLAGQSEYALRLPSALLAVLAVPAAWRLAGGRRGRLAPAAAAALLACSPVAVAYAREARMYAPTLALGLLALAAAERVVVRPDPRRWALYLSVGLLALASHYTALAAVGAGALLLLLAVRRVGLRAWLLAHALLALIAAAWTAHLWSNRDAWLGRVWHPWAGRTALADALGDWASAVAGAPVGPTALDAVATGPAITIALVLAAALLGLLAPLVSNRAVPASSPLPLGARLPGPTGPGTGLPGPTGPGMGQGEGGTMGGEPAAAAAWKHAISAPLALALAFLALAPLAVVLAAESARPSWNLRYTLVGLPALLVLAAAGAGALPRWLGPLVALSLVAAQLPALPAALRPARDDWRAVAAVVGREGGPDDLALAAVEPIAAYYLAGTLPVAQRPIALGRRPEEVVAELDERTRGRARVWLVPARDGLLDPADLVGTALARHAERRQDFDLGQLAVARLDLRPRDRLTLGPPLRPFDATFGEAVHLVGYAAARATAAGAPVADLSLDLRLERRLGEDYKLFAHLLDGDGQTVAQQDVLLVDPTGRPTSQLDPGTRLRVELAIGGPPERVARGRAVGVGLYQLAPPGARLPLSPPAPEHRLVLPLAE
jgi:hypothetical protein